MGQNVQIPLPGSRLIARARFVLQREPGSTGVYAKGSLSAIIGVSSRSSRPRSQLSKSLTQQSGHHHTSDEPHLSFKASDDQSPHRQNAAAQVLHRFNCTHTFISHDSRGRTRVGGPENEGIREPCFLTELPLHPEPTTSPKL